MEPTIGETKSSRMCAGVRRAASLFMATIALVTFGVSIAHAQWPTTCVELNDLAEAAAGNHQNVGIYQRTYGDQAEAQCQNDHRDDVRRTFAWAIPSPVPEPVPEASPAPRSLPPTEHTDYQRVRNAAFARSGDADLAHAVAADVMERGAIDRFLRGTDPGVQFGFWSCPRRNAACPVASEAPPAPQTPQIEQGAQSQVSGTGPSIRLRGMVGLITLSIWHLGYIDLSNLDADQAYEVVVSSSIPDIVGIGDCLGASEWTTVTGPTSLSLWFVIRGCAPGTATVTIEVLPGGANSAAASLTHHVTTEPIPSVPPHQRASVERAKQEVRDILAGGGQVWPVQRPFPPRLFGYASSATTTATTVSWATWWASAPTGDVEITGFQIRYWPHYEPSKTTTVEITDANAWQQRLTGLAADTRYTITMRACTNQEDCTAAEWSRKYGFTTLPG